MAKFVSNIKVIFLILFLTLSNISSQAHAQELPYGNGMENLAGKIIKLLEEYNASTCGSCIWPEYHNAIQNQIKPITERKKTLSKTLEKKKFTQHHESHPADLIIVHEPSHEVIMYNLHPFASLFEDVTSEKEIQQCYKRFSDLAESLGIQIVTVREALRMNREDLVKMAMKALRYKCRNEEEGFHTETEESEVKYYLSDLYKRSVIEKLTADQMVDVVLTRPTYEVRYVPENKSIEYAGISLDPVGNLIYVRDQQITTRKGVVLGRSMKSARKLEHEVMKQVFNNLNIPLIGEIPEGAYLEGGDFFIAKPDLAMVGIGIRTTFEAAAYLMQNDLLGTDRFALVIDDCDRRQHRMHLDTIFNIVNEENVFMIDFDDLSKIHNEKINRKVHVYTKKPSPLFKTNSEVTSDMYGDYILNEVFEELQTFLEKENYNVIKVSHEQQSDYMINFLNIGNNSIIGVNRKLKDFLEQNKVDVDVHDLHFDAVLKMYGAVHCATQVSRVPVESEH